MPSKLNNAVTDNVVTDKPTTTWFFVFRAVKENHVDYGNFTSEITGELTMDIIRHLERDISNRLYKGKAQLVVTNFIKMESE